MANLTFFTGVSFIRSLISSLLPETMKPECVCNHVKNCWFMNFSAYFSLESIEIKEMSSSPIKKKTEKKGNVIVRVVVLTRCYPQFFIHYISFQRSWSPTYMCTTPCYELFIMMLTEKKTDKHVLAQNRNFIFPLTNSFSKLYGIERERWENYDVIYLRFQSVWSRSIRRLDVKQPDGASYRLHSPPVNRTVL